MYYVFFFLSDFISTEYVYFFLYASHLCIMCMLSLYDVLSTVYVFFFSYLILYPLIMCIYFPI